MRIHLRLLLLCTALLCAGLATTAAADRDDKTEKAEKVKKHERAERNERAEKNERAERNERAADHAAETKGERGRSGDAPGREKADGDPAAPATEVGALAGQIAQPGAVEHPEHTTFGATVAAQPNAGTVSVQVPGSDDFVVLTEGAPIPVGSYVDASAGLIEIGAEAGPGGAEQNAVVTGSVFRVGQMEDGATVLALKGGDFSNCDDDDGAGVRARGAAKRKRSGDVARGIWAAGKGRFRTKGRHGAATVRGTRWATVDRCHSTTVKVFEGIVDVADFGLGRTVAVGAGERYVARERRG